VGETEGNGKGSVVMCGGLVQSGRDGWKWKVFSGFVCWFGTGWDSRRHMERFQWLCVLVWYMVGETEGNRKVSVVMCVGLVQAGGDVRKRKFFSADMYWFSTG
jgi:hypothetical protein